MNKITANEKKMFTINSLFTLSNALSSVFVNVFLYVYTESLIVMTLYTCLKILMYPPLFTLSGKVATKKNFGLTLSIGLIIMMAQLIFILYFNELFGQYHFLVYVSAIVVGIGESFYWLSIVSLNQYVSQPETRNRYFGVLGIFNNLSSIIAPLLATGLIEAAPNDMAGYTTIFKVVLVLYAIISAISFTVRIHVPSKPFTVLDKLNLKDKNWEYVFVSTLLFGLRDSLILTLAGLLVYNATGGNGSSYSKLLALFAVIAITSFAILIRKMNNRNRDKYYLAGCILTASSTMVLVLWPTMGGAIYYGLVNALASPMFTNPYNVLYMNAISGFKNENLIGRVIGREIAMTIGRCSGMLFIVLVYMIFGEPCYLPISVTLLSLAPVFQYLYHKKTFSKLNIHEG